VSQRTIYRDIELFRKAGHPATYERGQGGYVWGYETVAQALFVRTLVVVRGNDKAPPSP
jgi:hypothetical protein